MLAATCAKSIQPQCKSNSGASMSWVSLVFLTSQLCTSLPHKCLFTVPPDINPEKTSSDTTVKEGDDATLVCHASGQPPPTIIWRRENGEPFLVKKSGKMGEFAPFTKRKVWWSGSLLPFFSVKRYVGEFLVLHKVRRKDMGAFMCIASNNVPPSVSKRILLNVNCKISTIFQDLLLSINFVCSRTKCQRQWPSDRLPTWKGG